MSSARSPYRGSVRGLVLAFDIGTTYSGVSYSILDPGQIPEIRAVTRFPGQAETTGYSKIPTIIYYDQYGKVPAVGAEATQESLESQIKNERWVKAEWFKLHVRPTVISKSTFLYELPPLPVKGKSVINILADFLRYLFRCTKDYVVRIHGVKFWSSVESSIKFVLTHPNGWGEEEHQQMRKAAVLAGLVPEIKDSRVHLVSEGEANLHLCIESGFTLKSGSGVLIVDAGGGTIDISAYGRTSLSKDSPFKEISLPECHLHGSAFVTSRARTFLEDRLLGSKFFEKVETMTQNFDKTSKLTFTTIEDPLFIHFSGHRDNDLKLDIRKGILAIPGANVATFFKPSILCIANAIQRQRANAQIPISSVFLVGGFSASEWLFTQLKASFDPASNLTISRPNSHRNKTVADGAVSYYLDRNVFGSRPVEDGSIIGVIFFMLGIFTLAIGIMQPKKE
ncbi:Heat shock protein 12A [Hypsizygus marmoreus]|uniref:Heat shock protein 12A n=1 Tax=Hypsizygus marmoreus TaxID=39966 RepID=A0A369JES2_HYPMA|nr:Heat shock protein 12A [Hypsizygus marmoreus]